MIRLVLSGSLQILDNNQSFQRIWSGLQRVFLWTETEKQAEALEGIDAITVYFLGQYAGKVIAINGR